MFEAFLLFSAESDGCYRCDAFYNLRADIYNKIQDIVNILHDMMEKKIDNNYPVRLLLIDPYDGEIVEDMELRIGAGCLSGLCEVSFKHNGLKYYIRRGNRKNED